MAEAFSLGDSAMAGLDLNFDPFSRSDPFARLGKIPGLDDGPHAPRQRPVYRQPLPAAQSESFGRQVLNTGTSGLSHVLGTLDKPGQAVRGILAGKGLGSLKHLIPFSDTLGITDEASHTSGRDLTNQYGITSKGDKGWGAWGAGLAADLVTDPLSYATFGAKHALTGAGQVAQKAGALKGLSREAMVQGGHSGLVRFGVPFGGPSAVFGTGAKAQQIARAGDRVGDYLKFGNPIGRSISANFDHSVNGAVDAITQRGWQKYGMPALEAAKQTSRGETFDALKHLNPLIEAGSHPESVITDAARAVAEGVPHSFDPALAGQLQPLATQIGATNARHLGEARQVGLPLNDVNDAYANYVHRQALDVNHKSLQLGGKKTNNYPVVSGSNIGRDEVFKNIPGGTGRLNDWFSRFASTPAANSAPVIRQELEHDLIRGGRAMTPEIAKAFDDKALALASRIGAASPRYRGAPAQAAIPAHPGGFTALTQGPTGHLSVTGPTAQEAENRLKDMLVRQGLLSPTENLVAQVTQHAKTAGQAAVPATPSLPFFTPDLASDLSQRGAQHARTIASAQAALGTIADNAKAFVNDGTMVPAHEVLRRLGLKTFRADQKAGTPIQGAMVELANRLGINTAPLLNGNRKALRNAIGGHGLTAEHADQITKAYQKWAAPEQVKAPIAALDSITNAFKALAYPIWPAAHVRNAATAFFNNTRRGVGPGDYLDQLKVMTGRGGRDLGQISPAFAKLPEAERIDAIRRAQFSSGNIFGGHGMTDDISDNALSALSSGQGRFTPHIPGSDRVGPTGNLAGDTANLVLKEGLLSSLASTGKAAGGSVAGLFDKNRKWGQSIAENLGIKGVGGAAKDVNPAVKAGRKAGTNIEDFFRGAQWNREVRKGATPEMAANEVNRLHFDYDALTQTEKQVMRRLVPFYTYARRNLPLQVSTAVHSPGIINAQYKPFYQEGPGEKGYVPQYLNSGVAIPTGPEVDGKRQYISKLGLPAEEAFEKLHFNGGALDVRKTALDFASQLNPVLKAPLEQLFNTQFHTQRKLSDLKPSATASALGGLVGDDNPQLLSQILANTPATRFFSSADKLMDNRKGIAAKAANLLSGVRVTDVDTERQRAVELRSALEQMMQGHPSLSRYSSFYVKPEDVADLSPDEIEMMRLYSGLQDRARAYAKGQRIGVRQ